jgi:dihydrofolate reductase
MGKVILTMTISIDGFVAGLNTSLSNPMGDGGLRLHDWIFASRTEKDTQILDQLYESSGAVIVGGRTYHYAMENAWGGASPFTAPALVVTKDVPKHDATGFMFVPEGIKSALLKARAIAGKKNVWVMGGANLIQQFIKEDVYDEIWIHIAPVILQKGVPLFKNLGEERIELKAYEVLQTPGATHIKYRRV